MLSRAEKLWAFFSQHATRNPQGGARLPPFYLRCLIRDSQVLDNRITASDMDLIITEHLRTWCFGYPVVIRVYGGSHRCLPEGDFRQGKLMSGD